MERKSTPRGALEAAAVTEEVTGNISHGGDGGGGSGWVRGGDTVLEKAFGVD